MTIKVEYVLSGVAALGKRQINDVMRESMMDLGKRWHSHPSYLASHFKNSATTQYGYTKRRGEPGSNRAFRGSYSARKLKKYGHTRPLEFSGEAKREALSTQNIHAAATSNGASVVIRLPQKFNFQHKKSKVRMADEVRAVTASQLRELEVYLVARIEKRFTQAGRRAKAKVNLIHF